MTDDDKTPVSVDPVAKWDRRFRRNRAERERALRREAGKPPSLPDADFDEISERLERLELKESKPPGPIRWLWGTLDRLPPTGRVVVVLVVLVVGGGLLGWRGAIWLGLVP